MGRCTLLCAALPLPTRRPLHPGACSLRLVAPQAVEAYNKSLMEHRSADTLKRLQETEKALKVRVIARLGMCRALALSPWWPDQLQALSGWCLPSCCAHTMTPSLT